MKSVDGFRSMVMNTDLAELSDLDKLRTTRVVEFGGNRLARNTAFNIFGQVVPMLAAIATIPYIVRGLGSDRFGILSIAWLLLGYFGFLDLGLGRAATKFIAESLARKETDKLPELVWTCAGLQTLLGTAGGLLLAAAVPLCLGRLPSIPPTLLSETRETTLLLAISLPFILATNGFRAVLEATQRFDLVNLLRIPASVSVYFMPVIGLWFGFRLPGIVLLLTVARILVCIAHLACCFVAIPELRFRPAWSRTLLAPLLRYGGWVTVTNLVNPLLLYLDRFMVGSLLSLSLLGYYTVPLEAMSRLLIVPASLATTLFPVFSGLGSIDDLTRLTKLYSRSLKYLLLLLAPPVFVVVIFAREILTLWMGAPFAGQTTQVMQILALGMLFNSFAHIPFGFLQGVGRPELAAKILLFELPLYLPVAWFLITHFGIRGAATGWTVRVALEALVFTAVVFRVSSLNVRACLEHGLVKSFLISMVLAGAMLTTTLVFRDSLPHRLLSCAAVIAVFSALVWRKIFDSADRQQIEGILPSLFRTSKKLMAA